MKKKALQRVKYVLLILLTISAVVSTDLLLNYLSTIPIQDGSIGCTSLLHRIFGIFGDHGWSLQRFRKAAVYSVWANAIIGLIYTWICALYSSKTQGGRGRADCGS